MCEWVHRRRGATLSVGQVRNDHVSLASKYRRTGESKGRDTECGEITPRPPGRDSKYYDLDHRERARAL